MLLRRWGFNFETTGIPILYVELRCEIAFSESYMAVSLVDITKLACESLEFQRPLYVISNGVKNCLRTRKKCLDLTLHLLYCKLLCELFD